MLNRFLRRALLVGGLAATALVTGCATPANSVNMVVRAGDATAARSATPEALKAAVAIRDVTGGKETNPMWVSNVGNSDFERALEDSLRSVGMLAANRQSGRYQLVAHLEKLEQPFLGFDMTVTAAVAYTLIERSSGKTVWQKSIATPYTAKVGDAFVGTERLRLANEGSVRQNITQLIGELQQAKVAELTLR